MFFKVCDNICDPCRWNTDYRTDNALLIIEERLLCLSGLDSGHYMYTHVDLIHPDVFFIV